MSRIFAEPIKAFVVELKFVPMCNAIAEVINQFKLGRAIKIMVSFELIANC
jgi:hypothetical protein